MSASAIDQIKEYAAGMKVTIGKTAKLADLALSILDKAKTLSKKASGTGPRVIAIYDIKGGVGKTTATVHIAIRFAELGFKVCVIDFDNNPRLTNFILGAGYSNAVDATSCKEIVHQMKHYQCITAASVLGGWAEEQELELRSETLGGRFAQDQFFIVPGTHDSNIDEDTGGEYTEFEMTRNIRNSISYIVNNNDLDFIFIDNAASANTRIRSTMWSITDLMIPTDGKGMSIDTVAELSHHVSAGINATRSLSGIPPFTLLGVFLNNMATLKSDEAQAAQSAFSALEKHGQGFHHSIKNRKVYQVAYKKGYFAWEMASYKNRKGQYPSVEAHEEVTGLADEMLGQMINRESKGYFDYEITAEIYDAYQERLNKKRAQVEDALNKKLGLDVLDSEEDPGEEDNIQKPVFNVEGSVL